MSLCKMGSLIGINLNEIIDFRPVHSVSFLPMLALHPQGHKERPHVILLVFTRMIKTPKCVYALLFFLFSSSTLTLAGDSMKSPFNSNRSSSPQIYQTSTTKLVFSGLIQFYSTYISPADGPRSPSYPTGSAYGKEVLNKYGLFPGIFLIADRLFHEADVNPGFNILIFGRSRYYDPIVNNTYWWDTDQ